MMQNRLLRNLSANTLQLIINQLLGLLIFYVLSKGLDKNIFGQLNWSLAVLLAVFALLSFGIDQVMVKKISAGAGCEPIFAAFFVHALLSGGLFYGLLILQYFLFPGLFPQQNLLLFLGIGKLFIFLSTPFKQMAMGVEKFASLMYMSVLSNAVKGTGLLYLLVLQNLSVTNVLVVFIAGDVTEFLFCIILSRSFMQRKLALRWNRTLHFRLIKESLPQAGVVMFTAIMARFDWIMIGILASSVALAEYSFAWKVFEVSTLPLLIIAPLMIPLFTRLIKQGQDLQRLSFFLEWQIIIASFVALVLNLIWTPVIDLITNGKYGAVNAQSIFILSLCMPLLYFNNYLWTINFAEGKLKRIFFIIGISFIVNIVACCILIPLYKAEGAAFANLLTVLVQSVLYVEKSSYSLPFYRVRNLLVWPFAAAIMGICTRFFWGNNLVAIVVVLCCFILIVIVSKLLNIQNWKTLKLLYQ